MGVMLPSVLWDCPRAENREHNGELHQIEIAGYRAGRLHRVVASAGKQGSELGIDGLRSLRLLHLASLIRNGRRPDMGSVPKPNFSILIDLRML